MSSEDASKRTMSGRVEGLCDDKARALLVHMKEAVTTRCLRDIRSLADYMSICLKLNYAESFEVAQVACPGLELSDWGELLQESGAEYATHAP